MASSSGPFRNKSPFHSRIIGLGYEAFGIDRNGSAVPHSSASFKTKAPFHARIIGPNYEYQSFGIDFINPSFPISFGCISVTPASDFNSSGTGGGPFQPSSSIYIIANIGTTTIDWTVTLSQAWLATDVAGGTLNPGEGQTVTITLNADNLQKSATPYVGLIQWNNITNGCGDLTTTASLNVTGDFLDTISFVQYDGPFVYPACMTQYGNRYYKTETASGDNVVKYTPIAGEVQNRICELHDNDLGIYAWGLITTTFSGSASYDMSCVATGNLSASLNRAGAIGAYDFPGRPGTTVSVSGGSMDTLFTGLSGSFGFSFASEFYGQFPSNDGTIVTREWYSIDKPEGYFAGQFGGPYDSIWCQGHRITATLSDPVTLEDLGIPVARSGGIGSDAQTQTMHAFDGTTRTNLGNMSRALIAVPVDASRAQLTGEFTFLVTPDAGDPYTIIIVKDFPITGALVTGTVDFPMLPDAIVKMTSWTYSYQASVSEDFVTYEERETILLDPSPSWNAVATFDAPPPNTDCWDDFSTFPGTVTSQITTEPYGYRWNGIGTFLGVDYVDCYDDFEGYQIGVVSVFAQGIGWAAAGATTVADYTNCYDDFESYPIGTIAVLDYISFNNKWEGNGAFLVVDYLNSWDDLESYADGPITTFTFTSTNNLWNGDGRSITVP